MADEDNLVTLTLLDRQMQFHRLSPGQLLLVSRMIQRLRALEQRGGDEETLGGAYSTLMVKILDVIDALFVSEQDREDVENAVLQRRLELQDLMQVLHGGRASQPEPDDADPATAPKTLKSKKAAATTVKKTATRRARS